MPNLLPRIQNNFATLTHKVGNAFGGVASKINDGINGLLSTTVHAENPPPAPSYTDRGQNITDQDLGELRKVLFAEVSNRSPQKQALEAQTITNTAINRIPQYAAHGQNFNLSQVLQQPNQYQGYNSPEYQRFAAGSTTPVDEPKIKAIDSFIGGLKQGQLQDNTGGQVFYQHNKQGQIHLSPGSLYK